MLGRFPDDRDVLGATGEHGGVQALTQAGVDGGGTRVSGLGEDDEIGSLMNQLLVVTDKRDFLRNPKILPDRVIAFGKTS